MNEKTESSNALRGFLVMEELWRAGVREVCIAPGYRSTPLTLAAAKHHKLRKHVHFDERGLGFFALGLAKGGERPVAIVCTGGTAVANLHPAMVEAFMDRVPLIVLTADRPWELHDVGANQAIDQFNLFSPHVRKFKHVPTPTTEDPPEAILSMIDTVVNQAIRGDGPIHLNFAFREPFGFRDARIPSKLKRWHESKKTYITIVNEKKIVDPSVFDTLKKSTKGLVVIGKIDASADRDAVRRLCSAIRWPIFADVTSGIKLGNANRNLVTYPDSLKRYPKPDALLYVGGAITSKKLLNELRKWQVKNSIAIQSRNNGFNPNHCSGTVVVGDLAQTISIIPTLPESKILNEYLDPDNLDAIRKNTIGEFVATAVAQEIRPADALFIGNSLSIREFNEVATSKAAAPILCVNRGASGIDGNLATAAGFALATERPLTCVIGDLTALHDVNSLALVAKRTAGTIIIVVNDKGGGIFRRLRINDETEHFDEFFRTKHKWNFERFATTFDLTYAITNANGITDSYRNAREHGGNWLLEVDRL